MSAKDRNDSAARHKEIVDGNQKSHNLIKVSVLISFISLVVAVISLWISYRQ